MRKLLTVTLIVVTGFIGTPTGVFAQSPASAQLGTISGEMVDAGGRAVVSQRTELLRAGDVVQSTITGSRGEWSFSNVEPGEYVVRATINGKVAGIRVFVAAGQTVTNALIVAPSAAEPSAAFLAALGLLGGTLVTAAVVAAIIATVVVVTGS